MNIKTFATKATIVALLGIASTMAAAELVRSIYTYTARPRPIEITINNERPGELSPQYSNEALSKLTTDYHQTFDRTINHINFIITFFAALSALFLVLLGLFSFSKVKEVESLLRETEALPERILRSYHQRELPNLLSKIHSSNDVLRSDAIRTLTSNPEVRQEHYGIIYSCLVSEIGRRFHAMAYNNILGLFELLLKLDPHRAIGEALDLAASSPSQENAYSTSISYFLPYFATVQDTDLKARVARLILSSDTDLATNLIFNLHFSNSLDSFYLSEIASKGSNELVERLLTQLASARRTFQEEPLIQALSRRGATGAMFTIVVNPRHLQAFTLRFQLEVAIAYFMGQYFEPDRAQGMLNSVVRILRQTEELLEGFLKRVINAPIDPSVFLHSSEVFRKESDPTTAGILKKYISQ